VTDKGRLDGYGFVHRMTSGDVTNPSGFEARLESFSPIDAQNSVIDAADMRFRILRPPGTTTYEVLTGIAVIEGYAGFAGKSAGSIDLTVRLLEETIVRHRVTGAGDASAGATLISRFRQAVRLRSDQSYMVWWRASNIAVEYGTNAAMYASAPSLPTDPPYTKRSIRLNRVGMTTSIAAIAFELRSPYGRILFGDPATEK
jgi:hypothetical protein